MSGCVKKQRMQSFYINVALKAAEQYFDLDIVKEKAKKALYGGTTRSVHLPLVQTGSGKSDTWAYEFGDDGSGKEMYDFVRANVEGIEPTENRCIEARNPFTASQIKRLIESRNILLDGQVYVR